MEREIHIALLICTYHREEFMEKNIKTLLSSKFFCEDEQYFGKLDIIVIDNGKTLKQVDKEYLHVICNNENSGGSGGFQKALVTARELKKNFSHVIFMDDDVLFELESFYILYDFLQSCSEAESQRPVAGRMFCMDRPNIQYTAAEIWNGGNIEHVEHMRNIKEEPLTPGRVIYDSGAQYGGWWFCCYPMSFAKENDIIPFFIHCDDVEYGLRCGTPPILIEGVQVWHETFDKRLSPIMLYYDTRNPLFVNKMHGLGPTSKGILEKWKANISYYHARKDWISEYYIIRGLLDFIKGLDWLYKIQPGKYHEKLKRVHTNKYKNAVLWRIAERRFKKYARENI